MYAWGPTGHRVIGQVAEWYLNRKAKKALQEIMGQESLAIASTWMDEVRSDDRYDSLTDWHWVTIPDGETYADTQKNPNGDVIEAIGSVVKALKSHTLPRSKEIEYIRILVHLVGDLHQPLHVGMGTDHGGGQVQVKWFGDNTNLHHVWDSDIIDNYKLSYTELAASLHRPSKDTVQIWQQSAILDWANEDMKYRPQVYAIGDGKLGYDYAYKNWPLVEERLMMAGVRLAGILNDIYGR